MSFPITSGYGFCCRYTEPIVEDFDAGGSLRHPFQVHFNCIFGKTPSFKRSAIKTTLVRPAISSLFSCFNTNSLIDFF